MRSYDLAIIGSGPGGYVAGLYASRHNLKTCVIEKDLVGGTCLNRGCIPTKSLLHSCSILDAIRGSSIHGVDVDGYRVNFEKMTARKTEVTNRLRTGIETLFRANKIDLIKGGAQLSGQNAIDVGEDAVSAKHIILAVGSKPAGLGDIKIDDLDVLSSDGALSLGKIPKSLLIIGGGVIGCEFATLFNALGAKVTIVELMDRLIPAISREASKKLEVILKKRKLDVFVSSEVERLSKGAGLIVSISGGRTIEAEKVLVSVGRIPNTDGLGLEKAGLTLEKGRIAVDECLRTKAKTIYAIGDCVDGPQLAHKAFYDAILAVDNIRGKERRRDYSNIPNCIWTNPEIASVGLTEEEARAKHPDFKCAKFPYLASGKAFLKGSVEGYVKMLGDSKGKLLGVEIFGDGACDLIGEAGLARTIGVNIGDWAGVIHGHPTLSEMFQEAAHVFCGTPIHSI